MRRERAELRCERDGKPARDRAHDDVLQRAEHGLPFPDECGPRIPLHNHEAVQHGFVTRGRVRFLQKGGPGFEVPAGSSYVFGPWEEHGAEVLEDSEVIEFFTPMRPEYADN